MVFSTASMLRKVIIPDQFWKQRRVFRITAHLFGRERNCYRLAVRATQHQLRDTRWGRQQKKKDITELRETRINAAAEEHGLNRQVFLEALSRCNIFLNKKVLADLAIWEPRTFKALTDIAKVRSNEDGLSYPGEKVADVSHFITRGLLRDE